MEINKQEVQKRFRKSISSYDENAQVQKVVIDRLCPMILTSFQAVPLDILEIGCGTGLLTAQLKRIFTKDRLFINDLVDDLCRKTAVINQIPAGCCLVGDIEQLELPEKLDLIVSASTFQWFTEPDTTFKKLSKSLKPGGKMVFSTFGKCNLQEIRQTTGGGLPYRTKEELIALLAPYFDVEQVSEEFQVLYFDTPLSVLHHLKRTGVNVSGERSVWTKGRINRFVEEYNARYALDGKVPLTYHPLYFVCKKRGNGEM